MNTTIERIRFEAALAQVKPHCASAATVLGNLPTDDLKFMVLYRRGARVEMECDNIIHFRDDAKYSKICRANLKLALQQLAAFGMAWLATQAEDQDEVFTVVWRERERQMALRRENPNKYPFALEHPLPDVSRKFRVVGEEIGEVSDAISELESATPKQRIRAICHRDEEITQVTAMSFAWLESFEVQS